MADTVTLLLPFSLLFSFSIFKPSISFSSTDSFIYTRCSPLKYDPSSPYQTTLNSLLLSLATSASTSSYNLLTSPASPLSALHTCRGDIASTDCAACVHHAVAELTVLCAGSAGASLQLDGCYLRYDNESFVGAPDTSLALKRCGSPEAGNAYDAGAAARREEVLERLAGGGGGGSYRVGSAGYARGVAQCVGDLSPEACTECVWEAVQRLRNGCAGSVRGEVYLGKCYARYSDGGAYSQSTDDTEDEVGRTVAIVAGVVAGVAVIIIFLSVLRKVCGSTDPLKAV